MSEFECKNGHLMLSSQGPRCKICGEKVFKMDGKSNRELREREATEQNWEEDSSPIDVERWNKLKHYVSPKGVCAHMISTKRK